MFDLDKEFNTAFQKISLLKTAVAPDHMLKLYAFYKQATCGNNEFSEENQDLRSGFKFNAWMQLKGMSQEQAKREYIKLASELLIKNNKNDE